METDESFRFCNVSVSIGKKKILHDIFGATSAGEMMAIMGPSGAGKSTLFNALVGRRHRDSGEVLFNGKPFSKTDRRHTGYVIQNDFFYADLTLQQTLEFYAQVSMPQRCTAKKRAERIEEVIHFLELSKCRHTRIGSFLKPGLSGGEKKRASIAVELLKNPKILLLDEPTSGLDTSLALCVIKNLSQWAVTKHRIVIATIHQPSSQIFHMFSKLLVLCDGRVGYFGTVAGLLPHLDMLHFPCHENWNPADIIVDLVQDEKESKSEVISAAASLRAEFDSEWQNKASRPNESAGHVNCSFQDDMKISDSAEKYVSVRMPPENDSTKSRSAFNSSFSAQYCALTKRYFSTSCRRIVSPMRLTYNLTEAVIISCVAFQFQLSDTTMSDMLGFIYFTLAVWSFDVVVDAVISYPEHRMMVIKERQSHLYRMSAFMAAIQTVDIPLAIIPSLVFFSVVFWTVGFSGHAAFPVSLLLVILDATAIQGLGMSLGLLFSSAEHADVCVIGYMNASFICGGFFIVNVAGWASWFRWLSLMNYSYAVLLQSFAAHWEPIRCSNSTIQYRSSVLSGLCHNATAVEPEIFLRTRPDLLPMWANIAAMFAFLIGFRLLAYVIVRIRLAPERQQI